MPHAAADIRHTAQGYQTDFIGHASTLCFDSIAACRTAVQLETKVDRSMNNGSSLGEDACWLNRRVQSRSSLIPPQPGARLESRAVTLSALGHKQTCAVQKGMSALPPKADISHCERDVRFVPKADIANLGR